MSAGGKRKGEGRSRSRGDASDATADGSRGSLPSVRPVDSELSSTEEVVKGTLKRLKPGSPMAKRASAAEVLMDEVMVVSDGTLRSKKKKKAVQEVARVDADVVGQMKVVTAGMLDLVMAEGVPMGLAKGVLEFSGRYEGLMFKLVAENERLRGRLDVYEAGKVAGGHSGVFRAPLPPPVPVAVGGASAVVSAAPAVVVPKPVETWSVVVRGKGGSSSKEVVDKVVGEVAPSLGVRIHEVRQIRDGAVIRTPSVAERGKIAGNAKFSEVGLEVSVVEKLGPKVVVQRVHAEITPDEFMEELFSMNLKGLMSRESFGRSVRLASGPWKTGDRAQVNVMLECTQTVADHLRATGVYVKWFRFLVRVQDVVPACFRCLGFGHRLRKCRFKENVCLRCGEAGHWAYQCPNELRCRDCALKGLPAVHLMMSAACPVYAAMVARVNARH